MDTFIQEYVLDDFPLDWDSISESDRRCSWFERVPATFVVDNFCVADVVPRYSTDISAAVSLAESDALSGKVLNTAVEPDVEVHWATFSNVPFSERQKGEWAQGETLALAICRAALLAV